MDDPATVTTHAGPARTDSSSELSAVLAAAGGGELLRPGATVGRYVVMAAVGAGGMGRVYLAFDPELDRKVALKLLRSERDDDEGRRRLVGEGRALARLAHPHVVTVFDVGIVDDQVFVAMEFVQGATLRGVLGAAPRGWRHVLSLLVPVAEGLVAIHDADLVHRDLKPDNVMLGDDGRVRVMDFGLARVPSRTTAEGATPAGAAAVEGSALTRTGARQGTPAYMAPEQWRGEPADARTDQFAYCVMLWEALYGERPFPGATAKEIERAVLAEEQREPPRGRGVPRWLRRVCARGLSSRPEQRFASMQALLAALARGRRLARVRASAVVAALLVLAGLGREGWLRLRLAQRTVACEDTGAELDDAWNDARRRALADALLATGVSHAATTAKKVTARLDEQAQAWRGARAEACLAVDVRGRWSTEQLDRARWCLDERKLELASLVLALTDASAEVAQRATGAAFDLSPVTPCLDERVLEAVGLPQPQQRAEIRAVQAEVARAVAVQRAGRYDEGLAIARGALARAEELEWRPLVAAARYHVGSLSSYVGALAEAESTLEDAYFEAVRAADPPLVVATSLRLVNVVGYNLARPADGRRWGRFAEAALEQAGDPQNLDRASLRKGLGDVLVRAGSYDEAVASYEQAVALAEVTLGPEHPWIVSVLGNLATAKTLGGAYDEARVIYERALAKRIAALGPEHPDVGETLHNLANASWATGRLDEAAAGYERALAIRTDALGPEHPAVAQTLDNYAAVLAAQGHHERARSLSERALALHEATLGEDHPEVATNLTVLASIELTLGDLERARSRCERARTIYEARLGPKHPFVATPTMCLGEIAVKQGRTTEAVDRFARALVLREEGGAPDEHVQESRFMLAKARWDAPEGGGRDRAAALALAREAGDAHRRAGRAEALAEVEAWLALASPPAEAPARPAAPPAGSPPP